MKKEWICIKLGQFTPFFYGKSLPGNCRDNSGKVPVYGSSGIVGFHTEALTDGPTIIIGRKGTVGALYYSPVPCWPIDTTFYISGGDRELIRYKYYLLKSLKLDQMNADSAVPGLNRDAAHSLVIYIPPSEEEQRAIAHILGTLDDKIELNHRMNETLEQMARAIFKSWFVDFDPVRAKMSGHWKKGESLPGLPAYLWDLFPDRLVPSQTGNIPEGWFLPRFEDITEVKQGIYIPNEELRYYPIGEYIYPVWGGNGIRGYARYKMYDDPVVLITCRGSNCGLINITESPSWVSNIAFACRAKLSSGFFLKIYLDNINFKNFISGSAQPQITYSSLQMMDLGIPISPLICIKFSEVTQPFFSKLLLNKRESLYLSLLRDALLPKLLKGKINLFDIKAIINEDKNALG
jgi:type I restriction enzyme S subunit